MKRFLIQPLLIVLALVMLTACNKSTEPVETTEKNITESTPTERIIEEPEVIEEYFEAVVLEVDDNSILVEPFEDSWIRNTSDRFVVLYTDCGAIFEIGDVIGITFNGVIEEIYPAQISGCVSVDLLERPEPVESSADAELRLSAYRDALLTLRNELVWPDGYEAEYMGDDVSANQFAICDIDSDGKDELAVKWTTASMAGTIMRILEYNPSTESWIDEYLGNPYVRFYSNKIIISDWSHNQGYALSIWPYTIYSYDSISDSYTCLGDVDCWDRIITDENFPDIVFPDEYDTDNVGVVYMITFDGYEKEYYSQSEYDAFYSDLLGQSDEESIQFYDLTESNINNQYN